ncbi:TIGR03118 family protein [Chitinophaga filiformis]|uniref:TIGR03118 family protein n=2 Tax=Chitinophaga filiformis TaxID=104663 RepID=A0A1G7R2C1_CHIFI|nr:TIGR03118 family protein [Chitinophaga filiformis]
MIVLFEKCPVINTINVGSRKGSYVRTSARNSFIWALGSLVMLLVLNVGCSKSNGYGDNNPPPATKNYNQVNLVTDVGGGPYSSTKVDANLINPWGIAVNPAGVIWITANGTGLSTVYDKDGNILLSPVSIGSPGHSTGGKPTGIVYNGTADFTLAGTPAKFIFDTEDGTILAWASGAVAAIVADRSAAHAVYKGLALAKDGTENFLYAANFYAGTIDVFDKDFHMVTTKPFVDPNIPAGYAPFNIREIGGNLYVLYAKQDAAKEDDVKGEGNGYVSIFKPDGSFVKRFASQGALNAPWGIVAAAAGFWEVDNTILIANFGDGKINVYDQDGKLLGPLMKGSNPIVIDGLWAIENNIPSTAATQLYFVAGPTDEAHGVFGYIMKAY